MGTEFLEMGKKELVEEGARLRIAEQEVWSAKRNIQICENRMKMAKMLLKG
jgi:hypothetical protein